jgi:hypothetical protein
VFSTILNFAKLEKSIFLCDKLSSNDLEMQQWQAWKILLFHWLVVRLEQDSYYYVLRREASDHFSHPSSDNRALASKRSFDIPTVSDKAL